jgi:cell division protease FtsH
MVTRFGMTEKLGQIAYESEPSQFVPVPGSGAKVREFSEETAREIDTAVRGFVDRAFEKAVKILTDKRAVLERGARLLLQKETLLEEDLAALFAGETAPVAATV